MSGDESKRVEVSPIRPTVGRSVHFYFSQHDPQPHAATITGVTEGSDAVDLSVFMRPEECHFHDREDEPAIRVMRMIPFSSEKGENVWTWPPR